MKNVLFLFLSAFCVSGCSLSLEYKTHARALDMVAQEQHLEALNLLKSDDFYTDKASLLVAELELGTVQYLNQSYYQALQHFDKAYQIEQELFTQSVTSSVMASVAGEDLNNYVAERYEKSMLRFYLSLTNYQLYLKGKYEPYIIGEVDIAEKQLSPQEKRTHLMAARAHILEWDSLQNSFYQDTAGSSIFKKDMLSKTWGAFVHQRVDTTADLQIAKQLYSDIEKVLLQNYNVYPAYNSKSNEFVSNYEGLHALDVKQIKKDFVDQTNHAQNLVSYAQNKKDESNLFVMVSSGLVTPKKAEKISYTIPWLLLLGVNNEPGFKDFILKVMSGQTIEFEFPKLDKPTCAPNLTLVLTNKKNKKEIKIPLVLSQPVSEIAYHEYTMNKSAMVAKIGARLAAKHATALVAAYAIYKQNPESNAFLAHLSYRASSMLIARSSKADLRFWGTLPDSIWIASVPVLKGVYTLEIKTPSETVYASEVDVNNDKKPIFIELRKGV